MMDYRLTSESTNCIPRCLLTLTVVKVEIKEKCIVPFYRWCKVDEPAFCNLLFFAYMAGGQIVGYSSWPGKDSV